ncbi:M48 family metallopeptidase [Magnetofaba australis]|uniref:Putative peptidase M48 Ste24p n=1 Tax=Magnetofaba australis IT-1 TaxID=1434232 RepID=A0A1Y2JZZ7_9PROT|nr:M48 family metallopeptidase [Magnetofaba australis]OSM00436.1 putative peptidase M48 Ste24p [Magnetofaba australis IT-1]
MKIEGILHHADQLLSQPCSALLGESGDLILTPQDSAMRCIGAEQWQVSDRIGSIPRRFTLPDGATFETRDNDAIDAWLAAQRDQRGGRLLHLLESRWRWIAVTLLMCTGLTWFGAIYVLPEAARQVAGSIPPSWDRVFGQQALKALDQAHLVTPSQLDEADKAHYRKLFAKIQGALSPDATPLTLQFRHSKDLGANALALASGTILVTDDLIQMLHHDEEFIAVMAHEAGHVRHRHTLRRVLQGSIVAVSIAMATGDLTRIADLSTGVPAVLLDMRHSRDFEREADDAALIYLRQQGIDPQRYTDILTRLSEDQASPPAYLSSHPPTPERIARFNKAL